MNEKKYEQSTELLVKAFTLNLNIMEQFRIEVADNEGLGHFYNIKALDKDQYQIYNDELERIGTIEIDEKDHEHCRQSLDCRIDLPLLNSIRDEILHHDELVHSH